MRASNGGGLLRAPRLQLVPPRAKHAVASDPAETLPTTQQQLLQQRRELPRGWEDDGKGRRRLGVGARLWRAAAALLQPFYRAQPHERCSRRWRLPHGVLLVWLLVATAVHAHLFWTGKVGFNHYPRHPVDWPARGPPRRADLRPLTTLNQSADSCAEALGVPKVALLFLTLGTLPFELTWRKWLRAAEGWVPLAAVRESQLCAAQPPEGAGPEHGSSGGPMRRIEAACIRQQGKGWEYPADALARQHLFSVYVHVPPDFPAFRPNSTFHAAMITRRVPTRWGTHTLVEATQELLWAAAADPANQRFVLMSESDVPLYDPLTLYQQLMSEARSRVNACAAPPGEAYVKSSMWRWTPPMQFNMSYWRKSSQWFVLIRSHAEAVLQDTTIFRAFEEHCWSGWVPEYYRKRDCFSDEHYLPTLLAYLGLQGECACEAWSGPAYVDWVGMKAHPRTFMPRDVNASLIRLARGEGTWQDCKAAAAQQDAARMFVQLEEVVGPHRSSGICSRLQAQPPPAYAHPLAPTCAVTARKFHNSSARAVHALFRGCEGAQLGLLGGRYSRPWWCSKAMGRRVFE